VQEIESVLFAITSIAEGISVEENVHLPVIFTLLTRIPCNNYCLVNQALYLVGEHGLLCVASLLTVVYVIVKQMLVGYCNTVGWT